MSKKTISVEDVIFYINAICNDLTYEEHFEYFEPLYVAIREDEEISKKFATITNSHNTFIEVLKNNEDYWGFFDDGCVKWQSSLAIMSRSQYSEVRIKAVKHNKLIAFELMHDPDPNVRSACVYASTKIADVLMHDQHPYVRAVCALKDESYGLKLMNDPSDVVREWCANWEACARQYVHDKSEKVRWNALYQNKNLAGLYINDPNDEIRNLALKYL